PGRLTSSWLPDCVLQNPRWSWIFVVGTHIDVNRVHLLVVKHTCVWQSSPAAGRGGDGHSVGSLMTCCVRGPANLRGSVAVSSSANCDTWKTTCTRGAARPLSAPQRRPSYSSCACSGCCSAANPGSFGH